MKRVTPHVKSYACSSEIRLLGTDPGSGVRRAIFGVARPHFSIASRWVMRKNTKKKERKKKSWFSMQRTFHPTHLLSFDYFSLMFQL